jgi:hypothetical protein
MERILLRAERMRTLAQLGWASFICLSLLACGSGDDDGAISDFPGSGENDGAGARPVVPATGAGAGGTTAGSVATLGGGNGLDGFGRPTTGGTAAGTAAGGATGGIIFLPPEKEVDVAFDAPQAGRSMVYVPDPAANKVAVVDARTFAIESLASGRAPTYAATVPGQDIALVLNVLSRDVSILRTAAGKTTVKRLPVGHDQNAVAIAPDGQHAVIFFDARRSTQLAQSFQDVSVVNLVPGAETVRGVSVGYRPRSVQFSRDSRRAFVITEDGVSVIDLAATDTAAIIGNLVPVGDKVGEPVSMDVQVVADGSFAVARRDGDPRLRLVDLQSGNIDTLALSSLQAPAPPVLPDAGVPDGGGMDASLDAALDAGVLDAGTSDAGSADAGAYALPFGPLDLSDLDIAPDGSFALAVVRNAGTFLRIPIPEGFRDPTRIVAQRIEGAAIGSVTVSKQGNVAALYTTISAIEALVLVDLKGSDPPREIRLRKAVRAVALSDSGSHALVLHTRSGSVPAGAAANDESRIDASDGYTLIEVSRGVAKLQLTPTEVRERDLLVTPDASRVFMLLRNDTAQVHSVEMADLSSFQVERIELAKPPTSLGLIPDAERLFVGQQSEGGMITFLDAKSGEVVHAVSGFELSGRVRQ